VKDLNRRDILKGLGMISAASLTPQIASSAQQKQKSEAPAAKKAAVTGGTLLNVILHGTYTVLLDQGQRVTLMAPNVSDHVYFAATADLDATSGTPEVIWRQIRWIYPDPTFVVNITGGSGKYPKPTPQNLPTDRVMIDWDLSKIKKFAKAPYHSLSLPWPDDIIPLRCDKGNSNTLGGQTYKDNNLNLTQLPTVYALAYQLPAGSKPTFKDNFNNDQAIPVGSDGVMRLHLFAEPPGGGDLMNPNIALHALCQMFQPTLRLDLSISSNAATPINDAKDMPPGVDRCEERSIGELGTSCSQVVDDLSKVPMKTKGVDAERAAKSWRFAGHPRNCMAVLINKS